MKAGLWMVLLVMALFFGSFNVNAATKNYMKKVKGVNWDIKKNKVFTFQCWFNGIGMHDQKAVICNVKTKKAAGKKNYVTTTLKIIYDDHWNVTPAEVDRILNASNGAIGGPQYSFIVDYDTGKNLEAKNNRKVTVKDSGYQQYALKKYFGTNGRRYLTLNKTSITYTITYPKKYDGLCILVGALNRVSPTSGDNAFVQGKAAFKKAVGCYSKTNKKQCHGLRIRAK